MTHVACKFCNVYSCEMCALQDFVPSPQLQSVGSASPAQASHPGGAPPGGGGSVVGGSVVVSLWERRELDTNVGRTKICRKSTENKRKMTI